VRRPRGPQLNITITITAIGCCYLTNRFNGSFVPERDLMSKKALDERPRFNMDNVMRFVSAWRRPRAAGREPAPLHVIM
jgi:hypothetical protein